MGNCWERFKSLKSRSSLNEPLLNLIEYTDTESPMERLERNRHELARRVSIFEPDICRICETNKLGDNNFLSCKPCREYYSISI